MFISLIACVNICSQESNYHPFASGQEPYKPLLKDGRVWNFIEVYHEKNDTLTWEYRIDGTTEIDGRICHNLFVGNMLIDHYYEEGPKVFRPTTSGWKLLFDFSLSPGDVIPNTGGMMMVDSVKTQVIKGVSRRCLYFPLAEEDNIPVCWIEGIGSSEYGIYNSYDIIIPSISIKLQSVYDGDVCIFEAEDLMPNTEEQIINAHHSFVEDGKTWITGIVHPNDSVLYTVYEYSFLRDTIIDNRTCKQLIRSELQPMWGAYQSIDTIYVGALYEEEGRVYGALPGQNQLSLWYDFASPMGTDIKLLYDWYEDKTFTIVRKERIQNEEFKGICTYVQMQGENSWACWCEGVGAQFSLGLGKPMDNGFLPHTMDMREEILLICTVGDEALYVRNDDQYSFDTWRQQGLVFEVDPGTSPAETKKRLDFTHVVKTRPKAPARTRLAAPADDEETLTGAYSPWDIFVSLKTLSGTYTVTLTNEAEKVVYRKNVQTSAAAAFITAAACYPTGNYTLTIENDEEAFIATLTINNKTGIRDLKAPTAQPSSSGWYNLAGQRVAGQPSKKGIYIKDGKKYIKK